MANPCFITYKGVEYSYDKWVSKLHDGLLNELIDKGEVKGIGKVVDGKVELPQSELSQEGKPEVQISKPIVTESETSASKEGFTEGKVLNKIFAGLKSKLGDKKGSSLYDAAIRLVDPNKNNIVEVRQNGVVVKEGEKYIFKPFGNTDASPKKWTLYKGIDVTDQFASPEIKTPTSEIAAEPKESQQPQVEQQQVKADLSTLKRGDKFTLNNKEYEYVSKDKESIFARTKDGSLAKFPIEKMDDATVKGQAQVEGKINDEKGQSVQEVSNKGTKENIESSIQMRRPDIESGEPDAGRGVQKSASRVVENKTGGERGGMGKELSDSEHATYIKDKFKKQFKLKGISEDQIDVALAIMDARAKVSDPINPDSWFRQIEDIKTGEFTTNKVKYQYIGEKGKLSKEFSESLDKAKKLDGKLSNEEIRKSTGWFRGKYDNEWRYETKPIKISEFATSKLDKLYDIYKNSKKNVSLKLSDLIPNNEIYNIYPDIKNIKIYIDEIKGKKAGYAKDKQTNKEFIVIGSEDYEKISNKSDKQKYVSGLFAHELQHYIQSKEGFSRGYTEAESRAMAERLASNKEFKDENEKKQFIKNAAYSYYYISAGEIEARDVESRSKLTEQERDAKEPFTTEDIPKENALIIKGNLFQDNKGAVETLSNGKKIIHALKSPDFSTMVHEIGHVIETELSEYDKKVIQDWAGTNKWDNTTSEVFAKGFEKYLMDGVAPNIKLSVIFEKAKLWLKEIYSKLKGSPIDKNISGEVKKVFDNLFNKQDNAIQIEKAGSVLQREQTKVGETGGERGGMEQSKQGQKTTGTGEPLEPPKSEKEVKMAQPIEPPKADKAAQVKKSVTDAGEKLKQLLKAKRLPEGTKKSGLGVDEIVDGAVKAIHAAIDAGVELSKAIEEGIKYAKDKWHDALGTFEEKEFKDVFNDIAKEKIGIKHAETEKIRQELGISDYVREQETQEGWEASADKKIKEGYNVGNLLAKIDNGHTPTPVETKILQKHIANLKDKVNKDPSDSNIEDLKRVMDATDKVGSEIGKQLVARKGQATVDDSLADYLITEVDINRGGALTDIQKKQVEKEFNEIKQAKEELEKELEKLRDENAKIQAQAELSKTKKATKKTSADFVQERTAIRNNISQKLAALRGKTNVNIIPYANELIAIAPDVSKLAKSYIEEGITKLDDIVEKLHDALKGDIPDIEKKDIVDVLAGQYNEKKLTKNEALAKLNELRTQAKLVSKLNKLMNGEVPKSETKKRQLNQEIADLKKKIKENDLQKMADYEKNLENNIARLEEDLKNNVLQSAKKQPILKLTPKAKALKDKYIKLRQEREIRLIKEQYANRDKYERTRDKIVEVLNVPRTIMSSMDFSAPLRQGLIASISHPIGAYKAGRVMFKHAFSQAKFDRWFYDIKDHPRFLLTKESGLYIADPHDVRLSAKEEQFMNNLAEKIPVIGKMIKGSERAYVSYLNKMRWDIFNRFTDEFESQGKTYETDPKLYKELAHYVNNLTGRGKLGIAETSAPILSTAIFAPRLIASRVNMLSNWANPYWYYKVPKEIRMMYFKDMAKFIGVGLTVIALAKLNGAQVEDDPRSSDFGKIRFGDTRYDIWGGHVQYIRLLTQLLSGQSKSTQTGLINDFDKGNALFGKTRGDVLLRFIRGKLAPIPAMSADALAGKTLTGDPVTFWGEAEQHLTPLIYQDIKSAVENGDVKSALGAAVASNFGIGVQTFGKNTGAANTFANIWKNSENKVEDAAKRAEVGYRDITLYNDKGEVMYDDEGRPMKKQLTNEQLEGYNKARQDAAKQFTENSIGKISDPIEYQREIQKYILTAGSNYLISEEPTLYEKEMNQRKAKNLAIKIQVGKADKFLKSFAPFQEEIKTQIPEEPTESANIFVPKNKRDFEASEKFLNKVLESYLSVKDNISAIGTDMLNEQEKTAFEKSEIGEVPLDGFTAEDIKQKQLKAWNQHILKAQKELLLIKAAQKFNLPYYLEVP